MQVIGFGTSGLENGAAADIVYRAICAGYRLIDCAAAYGNEAECGAGIARAVQDGIVRREDLLITGKVSNDRKGYDSVVEECGRSLNDMGLEYFDLYLIHWPVPRNMEKCYVELNRETWRAMQDLKKAGKVHSIGLSNFLPRHIESMVQDGDESPAVNEIEVWPMYQQRDLVRYCREHKIAVQGWGALGYGKVFGIKLLQDLAAKYGTDVARLCLKWCVQSGVTPIAKASSDAHIRANLDIDGVNISREDMEAIASLDSIDGRRGYYSYIRQQY